MMEVGPPSLFGPDDNNASFSVSCDLDAGQLEMTVHGRLSMRLSMDVYAGLRKCVAEHPSGIIVDLHRLEDPDAVSAPLWLAVHRRAVAMNPPVRLALAVPLDSPVAVRLRRIGTARYFPVFACATQARAALAASIPLTERRHRPHLPPDRSSVRIARDLVETACHAWDLAELRDVGAAIIAELADNAVRHAGTELDAAVWRHGPALHLSVRDRDPGLPRLLTDPGRDRSRGLWAVDGRAAAWGAMVTGDGKLVWATVRSRRQRAS
jgi:anti-sigma regulatory factor (Ser/Thr protein kinase)